MSFSNGLWPCSLRSALVLASLQIGWPVLAQSLPTISPFASSQSSSVSLRQALDAAWALDAASKTQSFKQSELAARQRAALGWIAGEPSVTLAHRTDRLNANGGLREYEAEIDLPLWNRRTQAATKQTIFADEQLLASSVQLAKRKIATTLLTLAADYAFSNLEHVLALRKIAEAEVLAADTERRMRAGDVARLDTLQAQSALLQAKSQGTIALNSKHRLQAQWKALTGLESVAALPTDSRTPAAPASLEQHPAVQSANLQLSASQAKLRLAETDLRDPMALALGITRERSGFAAASDSSLRIALRIPLGGESRNQPRIAAARSETAQAQAELETIQRNTQQEIDGARLALRNAQTSRESALERAQLATQMQTLITQAYRLGDRDLPTRLRADSEKNEADLAAERTQIELRRATAHLELTLGQLP